MAFIQQLYTCHLLVHLNKSQNLLIYLLIICFHREKHWTVSIQYQTADLSICGGAMETADKMFICFSLFLIVESALS